MAETGEIINIHKRKLQTLVLGRAIGNLSRYRKNLNILCLPGEQGWDIEFFDTYKAVDEIVCLEEDSLIYNRIAGRYRSKKGVTILNMKTSEFLATTEKKFDVIYIDYFSNLSSVVRFDLEMIFDRRIIRPGGKCVVNLYGSRESLSDKYANIKNYIDACATYGQTPDLNNNQGLFRARCFNAHMINCKRKYRVNCSSPSWLKYRSGKAFMYTGWFTVNSYKSKNRRCSGAVKISPHLWFMDGKCANIKEVRAKGTYGVMQALHRRGLIETKNNHYKALIQKFYNDNHRTPTCKDLGVPKGRIRGFTRMVRELGLCPPSKATESDILNELKRIASREGRIDFALLKKAKISRRLGWPAKFKDLCHKHGLPYYQDPLMSRQQRFREIKIQRLDGYLDNLDKGLRRTKYQHYSYISKRGLLSYETASKHLREMVAISEKREMRFKGGGGVNL